MGQGRGAAWFWVAFLVLRGRQGRRPGWFVFGLCEGRPGCYVGAAAPKAWCLGGDLEICVDSEFVDPAGSSSGNAKVVLDVTDVVGEIAEVGTEVRELKVGDKVVSKLIFWKAGGLAEYVAASESVTVIRPACVSAADAAGLPMAGLTALQALKAIGTKFDGTGSASNILITAASGGIGSYAVQLAKLGNHNVTATCGARNLELVESIGADEVLDYKTPEGAALKNTSGKKYDYIVNTTNGGKWSAFKPSLSSHGRVVDVSPNFGNFVASILTLFSKNKLSTVNLSLGMEDLRFLLELVKEGKLKMVLDSRHPFEKAADAWEKSLSGHATGKVIVEM